MPSVYETATKLALEVALGERRGTNELVSAYGQIWRHVDNDLSILTAKIERARAAGEVVNESWLYRQERFQSLIRQTERELRVYARQADLIVQDAQRDAIEAARSHADRLMADAVEQSRTIGVRTGFNSLPNEAIARLIGHTADGSPLRSLLNELPLSGGAKVRRVLVEGVAAGHNPRVMATRMRSALGGDLNRALTIARTETLRAYREGSRATYQANSDVVRAWRWQANKSARSCAVCWAMDGEIFDTEDPMGTHPNCRCAMVPVVDLREAQKVPKGADLFEKQSDATKLAILGPGKFDAYKRGDLALPDLVAYRDDPKWGPVRAERSLRAVS